MTLYLSRKKRKRKSRKINKEKIKIRIKYKGLEYFNSNSLLEIADSLDFKLSSPIY